MKRSSIRIATGLMLSGLMALAAGAGMPLRKGEKKGAPAMPSLEDYVDKVKGAEPSVSTPGSLWSAQSPFANAGVDDKARSVNDVVVVRIVEQTVSSAAGTVKSARTFAADSGFAGLFGQLGPRSGLQTLASPRSDNTLNGQAQTSSTSSLQTSLSGYVRAVLPNGSLVIEAVRSVEMDNQKQSLTVRGVARTNDIAADNSVLSTSLSNLEVLLNGKGVISDSVRQPNFIVRLLLKILEF